MNVKIFPSKFQLLQSVTNDNTLLYDVEIIDM